MKTREPPPEKSAKGEESTKDPMGRFRRLTSAVMEVSADKVRTLENREREKRKDAKK